MWDQRRAKQTVVCGYEPWLARARPLAALLTKYPVQAGEVKDRLKELKVDADSAKFLPLTGRGGDWVVILDSAGHLVHYVPVDGFF